MPRCTGFARLIAAGLVVLSADDAFAQQDTRPPELMLIQDFGTNGRLTEEGLRRHLRLKAFAAIDSNEDAALDVDEYTVARLYLRPGACGSFPDATPRFTEDRKVAGGPLTAATLDSANHAWTLHLDEMTRAHWDRAGGASRPTGLNLEGVRAYLRGENSRMPVPHTVAARMKALEKHLAVSSLPAELPELGVRDYLYGERFDVADMDGSQSIDSVEFAAAFNSSAAVAEFCALSGGDFLISRSEFITTNPEAPYLQRALAPLFPFAGPVALSDLRMRWQDDERVAVANARLGGLSPHGYVPNRGFLVRGARTVDGKTISYDANQPTLFVRVIKDFTVDDPTTAEPAAFSITKEKGKVATFAVDATFQLDLKPANELLQTLSLGVDIERNTATDPQVHRQRYYGTMDVFSYHGGWVVESHGLKIGPYIENDDQKDLRRLGGTVIWTPGLNIGSFLTSQWRPLGTRANWYVVPRLAVDLADVLGETETEPDGGHIRGELLFGLAAGRFNTTFKTFRRRGFEGQRRYSHFEELSAWWNVDELERFSVTVTTSWGKANHVDEVSLTKFVLAFGLKL
jgi:hypothetical protein